MKWDKTSTGALIFLYNINMRASEIAKRLPPFSRDAVLGKIFRLRQKGVKLKPKNESKVHR